MVYTIKKHGNTCHKMNDDDLTVYEYICGEHLSILMKKWCCCTLEASSNNITRLSIYYKITKNLLYIFFPFLVSWLVWNTGKWMDGTWTNRKTSKINYSFFCLDYVKRKKNKHYGNPYLEERRLSKYSHFFIIIDS